MAKGDDIQERFIAFAVNIIQLISLLPKTSAGKHIAGQLLRSGTSPAPNYAEARAAESTNDFVIIYHFSFIIFFFFSSAIINGIKQQFKGAVGLGPVLNRESQWRVHRRSRPGILVTSPRRESSLLQNKSLCACYLSS